jgi:RNA polymerase sigma-70 factor, ECF subfamily
VAAGQATLSEAMALARTEEDQLELAVRQHARLVYRIVYSVLRNYHDAEDATQETFLRALQHGKKISAVEDLRSWLARIAWCVAVDRNRTRTRNREILLEDPVKPSGEPPSAEASPDDAAYGAQVGLMLERLIAALPKKLREPLILSTIEEMSPREVAAALGIREAAVRSRIFRARQVLREKLTGQADRK